MRWGVLMWSPFYTPRSHGIRVLVIVPLLIMTRDGLERIQLPDHATVGDLKKMINTNLGIPIEGITLSRDKALVSNFF